MSKLKRARTIAKITKKDLELFDKEFNLRRCSIISTRASDDLQPRDFSLKAAKEFNSMLVWQVEELQEERKKLLERIVELEVTVSQLNENVGYKTFELKRVKEVNEVLRCNLDETSQEVQALRVDLKTKSLDLKVMEDHAKNCSNDSDFWKRERRDTNSELQTKKEENDRLKLEVKYSREVSTQDREESKHLANELATAEKEIQRITEQLQKAQKSLIVLQEENIRLVGEITYIKTTLECKSIELRETKQEVEYLRSTKVETPRASGFYVMNRSGTERTSSFWSDEERRNSTLLGDSGGRQSRRSDVQQSMFTMLQNLRRASNLSKANDILPISVLEEVKEVDTSDEDQQEEDFSRGTNEESEILDGSYTIRSVDDCVELTLGGQKPLKMDILELYNHLTAAAVRTNYPDIDLPIADLIRLGENMPFWQLHPYYTHIFESIIEKSRRPCNRRTGGWFKFTRKREQSKTPEPLGTTV